MKQWSKEKLEHLVNERRVECLSDISPAGTVDIRWTSNRRRETVQIESETEAHAETVLNDHQDTTPATIVEGMETEIFASQEDPVTTVEGNQEELFSGQEEEWVEFGETQVPETQGTAEPEVSVQPEMSQNQPIEQPAPKPSKPSKRPYIDAIRTRLEIGDMTKSQLLGLIMRQFPTVSRGGASTFLSDLLNPKYNFFRERPVVKKSDGALIFADRIPAERMPEEQPTEAPTEQPAE